MIAYNIFNLACIHAVVNGARSSDSEIYIQTSVSTVKYFGAELLAKMVQDNVGKETISLHLDHCNDMDVFKTCLDAGWTSVMIDASMYGLEENIRKTKAVVDLAAEYGAQVEGEIGVVGGDEDGFIGGKGDAITAYEDVIRFYEGTGVDLLAVGVGSKHGHYEAGIQIDTELLRRVHEALPDVDTVLHGGSGIPLNIIQDCIVNGGVKKINISTELKEAYYDAVRVVLGKEETDYNMINYMKQVTEELTKFTTRKCTEISNLG